MQVFEKIKEIVAVQLNIAPADITENTTFEDVKADSLDVVEVIMAIETAFDIELPDEEAERFKNIGTLTKFVEKQLATK